MKWFFLKNLKVKNLDGVDANLRGMYRANDMEVEGAEDGFHIPEEMMGFAKSIDGFNLANQKLRTEADGARVELSSLADWKALGESPDAVRTSIEEMAAAAAKGSEGAVNWEKMKTDMANGHARDIEKRELAVAEMSKSLAKYLVDSRATEALVKHKGAVRVLLPHIRKSAKVTRDEAGEYSVRILDEQGDVRGNGSGGFMSIEELVVELKGDSEFGRTFDAEVPSGSGAQPPRGGTRPNPNMRQNMSSLQKIQAGLSEGK